MPLNPIALKLSPAAAASIASRLPLVDLAAPARFVARKSTFLAGQRWQAGAGSPLN